MSLTTLNPRLTVRQQSTGFTAWLALWLVASSFWLSVSNAASLAPRAAIAGGVKLRVLPIGDSITWGAQSSDSNGYREALHDKLTARGNQVDFVGGVSSGTMTDGEHEGHRGFTIDGISGASGLGISAAPNIVLLHAGTNDINRNENVATAPARLRALVLKIISKNPTTAIFVCQIVPAKDLTVQARIDAFNDAIPGIVSELNGAGNKVTLVSMNEALSRSDIKDDLHPNDGGYQKMATAFYNAINDAASKGWIKTPGTPTAPEVCKATPDWIQTGVIASGAKVATTDGDFQQAWGQSWIVAGGACGRARVRFFDLDGDGLKDYACVDNDTSELKVYLSIPDGNGKPSGKWNNVGSVRGGIGREGKGVIFGDINGDGRDDFLYVTDDGGIDAWINQANGGEWIWKSIGRIATPAGIKATPTNVQMVDLDGDGFADLCIIDSTGKVTGWLNRGGEDMPTWHKLGVIASGGSVADGDKVILGDFTGEGRADYMTVGAKGKVNGYVNRINENAGAIPAWLPAITLANGPDGAERADVQLVDLTGDGKVDYLLVDKDTGKVRLWENLGTGGKYQKGEGVMICDLDGDGAGDYFWVDHTGKGWGYINEGKGTNAWRDLGNTAQGNHKREQVRMAVLTKTRRADYVDVNLETGRANWYQNLGPEGNFGWASRGEAAAGPKNAIESIWKWRFKGRNIRFADLDGDGFDDYLYIHSNGAVVMWRNLQTIPITWGSPVKVADGPTGVSGVEVQFADTNGDGLMDYIVVDRINGVTQTWHNLGIRADGTIRWNTPLNFAQRTATSGVAIKVAQMTNDYRADYMVVSPDTGAITLWTNRCGALDTSWGSVDCTLNEVEDAGLPSAVRWAAVGADAAFEVMVSDWRKEHDSGDLLKFAPSCSDFWHLGENMNCQVRAISNGCSNYALCSDTWKPAGYFIMNSFVSLNNMIANIYDSIGRVRDAIDSDLNAIADIFKAPPVQKPDLSLLLEILGVGFALVSAGVFNVALKRTITFQNNPNALGVIKDGTNGLVLGSLVVTKGQLAKKLKLDQNASLGISLSTAIDAFYESYSDLQAMLFDGSEESITILRNLFTDGSLTGTSYEPVGDIEIRKILEKALYAVIIPQSWMLSKTKTNIAVIKTSISCENDKSDHPDEGYYHCHNGSFYRIVAAIGDAVECRCDLSVGHCTGMICKDNEVSDPPGIDTFDGDRWGELTHADLIIGAIATFEANGKKNVGNSQQGGGLANPEDERLDLSAFEVGSPGVVTIPVCTADQLWETWKDGSGDKYPNFPCP